MFFGFHFLHKKNLKISQLQIEIRVLLKVYFDKLFETIFFFLWGSPWQ